MPVFIVTSLIYGLCVLNYPELKPWLAMSGVTVAGGMLIAASLIGALSRKLPTPWWHDGFATGSLLVWFGYWFPLFNDDAPMFHLFPLYFCLLSSVLTLTLINNSERFDDESITQLRYLAKVSRLYPPAIVLFVLIGLTIPEHYGLYAVAMTFFIVRYTMTRCLEIVDRRY